MTGKSSRAKGVTGERESADVFRKHGARITQVQNNISETVDYVAEWPAVVLIVDAKLRKRLHIISASRDIEAVAHDGEIPAVAYRMTVKPGQRAEPWRVSLRLEDFARLLGTP